ncbi:MAG: anhydro-N-acetylmuramic acid kinase [Pseudomonadota bacterium]|nr:anhydro-N-acetylmuramic acid kinase [Pseudomonadota bacterium]
MSGTSMDGIDVAMIETDGRNHVVRGPSRSYPYDEAQRLRLADALHAAVDIVRPSERPSGLDVLERDLTLWHAQAIEAFFADCSVGRQKVDIVGFHGQTVLHRPRSGLTVQLGSGALLARLIGISVTSNFRSDDVAAGGEGAPLAPVYHQALAASVDERPIAFVNIGGVANVTWIGSGGRLLAFDTGPGNAPIDDWVKRHTGEAFDRDGALARGGELAIDTWKSLATSPYFDHPPPKSLDRNDFDYRCLDGLSLADGAATLVHFTATSIARAADWFPERPKVWILCGGGRRNRFLLEKITGLLAPLGEQVQPAEHFGLNGDAIEAEAFAYLAVRSLMKLPLSFPSTTRVPQPMTGGIYHAI